MASRLVFEIYFFFSSASPLTIIAGVVRDRANVYAMHYREESTDYTRFADYLPFRIYILCTLYIGECNDGTVGYSSCRVVNRTGIKFDISAFVFF